MPVEAKHYHLQGLAAEKVFKTFMKAYAVNNTGTVSRNIPLHGGMYQLMRSMIFMKAVRHIDPNGIDKLLDNYELGSHSFRFKQLFLILLSEINGIDRITPFTIAISTDTKGYIQWVEAMTMKGQNGTMRLGKHYFSEHPIHISTLGITQSGVKQ